MKQLYIRRGNLDSIRNILIIGEESKLGGRDSGYKAKGMPNYRYLYKNDPYTGAENLLYVHACKNIMLNTKYKSDHDVHRYVKTYCKDLVTWDGESNVGYTNSREAFICKSPDTGATVNALYNRLQSVIHPEGFIENAHSHFTYNSTKTKSYRQQSSEETTVKHPILLMVIILIVLGLFGKCSETSSNTKTYSTDANYDYRHKMNTEADKWLLNKCQTLVVKKGEYKSLIDEAYYSKRFSGNTAWQVHSYSGGSYIVVRIRVGMTQYQEQKAIEEAVSYVARNY